MKSRGRSEKIWIPLHDVHLYRKRAGGSLGGGEAITWEQLADMRDNGVDIQAHSATHQDCAKGITSC